MKKTFEAALIAAALSLAALSLSACGQASSPQDGADKAAAQAIYISELMASNKSTLADGGGFPDWLELYNAGTDSVELEDFVLSDGKTDWALPALTLEAGEYRVIFCSSSGGDGLTAAFSLSKNGETVSLERPDGTVEDSFSYSSAQADVSLVRDGDGAAATAEFPTPGFANTDDGYAAFQSSRGSGALVINEAMTYNQWYLAADGAYYDWVEIKNVSSQPVLLSGYYISDDKSELLLFRLPELTLEPGGLYTLLCTDSGYGGLCAPFALDSGGDGLYITDASGVLSDYATLGGIRYGESYGRMEGENGFFFFSSPSPNAENSGGARLISAQPAAGTPQGVYEDASSVTVSLSAAGTIYYTLDGSAPDESCEEYSAPIVLSATGVIRCISVESGKLPSSSLDLSYIINEAHDLPVVSLVVDPGDFYDQKTGIYTNPTQDWEREASVAFFDGEDGFAMDCGVKIHGATSREAQSKKSFKLQFKDRYSGALDYDLFGNGVTTFSSVLLRAAQESTQSSNIRDILMHELAAECCSGLPTQSYKFCVMYLNGEYWGIYAFREAHSPEHYANHYGCSADSVVMTQGGWDAYSPLSTAYNYALNHDLSDPESYAYIQTLVDVDSLITWQIIESYSGNMDINPPNVRFYYSTEDGIARYALVDLDLGLFNTGTFELAFDTGYTYSTLLYLLGFNDEYRDRTIELLSEYLAGPLSDENVLNTLHSLTEEIRSEIPRDAERWDYEVSSWEHDLYYLEARLTVDDGMASRFAGSARYYLDMSRSEWADYFSEFAG